MLRMQNWECAISIPQNLGYFEREKPNSSGHSDLAEEIKPTADP
jgi:hypothetical protein